jgi:hypothetical protein
MKSIKQQYIDLREGRMTQQNFMRSLRMSIPQYVTNVTSFKDSVRILKNKGILNENIDELYAAPDPIEVALKSYLAKGYTYTESIRAVAAEEGIDEETLASQYPQDRVDIEGHEPEENDDEIAAMIAKAEEEEANKYTKNYDFPGNISEALNKDIKVFGQDLDKRLKEAGFKTLILVGKSATDEQKKKVQTDLGLAILEVFENAGLQLLTLYINPKELSKAKSVISKFQLVPYKGQVIQKGWTAKQVQGALNPGDIYLDSENSSHGVSIFARLAQIDTKVKNVSEAKEAAQTFTDHEEWMDAVKTEFPIADYTKGSNKWKTQTGEINVPYEKFFQGFQELGSWDEKTGTGKLYKAQDISANVYPAGARMDEVKERKGSSGKEQYSNFSEAENDVSQEVITGINIEHECFPEKPYEEIEKIVLKNIKKNPNYYTNYKLTGIRDYQLQTMDASKPETHQMKFVKGEDSYVDKARIMKPVKGFENVKASSNKANKEVNKVAKEVEELTHFAKTVRGLQKFATTGGKMKVIRLKEAKLNLNPGEIPNQAVQHASQFIDSNPVLRQISNDITLQNDGENAILKYSYYKALPDEAYNKLELQFNVEDDFEAGDEEANKITYILMPKVEAYKQFGNTAGFGDTLQSKLEALVREVMNEMFDGRDDMNAQYAEDEIK